MPVTTRSRRSLVVRTAGLAAVVLLLVGCPATDIHVKRGGATPGIVLVGDSLIYNITPQGEPGGSGMANFLRDHTGDEIYLSSAPGADWLQYGVAGHQDHNSTVQDYAAWFEAAWGQEGVVVIALATNDARKIHSGHITQAGHLQTVRDVVDATLDHASCVVLVNVRARGVTGMSASAANQINANLDTVAGENPYTVAVADWDAYASNSWFMPDDVHMTEAGELQYASYIGNQARTFSQLC